MTTIDPVLKQLVADADQGEASIPLRLYLPSGVVYGQTTTHDDFGRWATGSLGDESATTAVVQPSPDPEYVHLIAQVGSPLDPDGAILRVHLADVIAWTVA